MPLHFEEPIADVLDRRVFQSLEPHASGLADDAAVLCEQNDITAEGSLVGWGGTGDGPCPEGFSARRPLAETRGLKSHREPDRVALFSGCVRDKRDKCLEGRVQCRRVDDELGVVGPGFAGWLESAKVSVSLSQSDSISRKRGP